MYGLSDELIAAQTPKPKPQHKHISTTTPERYFHIRSFAVAGKPSNPRGVQAITAFARQDKDGKWYISQAECDYRDQFCRKTGRTVARRKWFAGKRTESPVEPTYESVFGTSTVKKAPTLDRDQFELAFRRTQDEGGHSYDPFDIEAAWSHYQDGGDYSWLKLA